MASSIRQSYHWHKELFAEIYMLQSKVEASQTLAYHVLKAQ